ncbi:MAG: hypothetical protein U5J97_09830 [Trueperaceae bacterium]|nr:hypothetical protein [Trueperaceae bacterium]
MSPHVRVHRPSGLALLATALVVLALLPSGLAQSAVPLERLAPAETVFALGLTQGELPTDDLDEAFADLDLDGARAALDALGPVFEELGDSAPGLLQGAGPAAMFLPGLLDMADDMGAPGDLAGSLGEACPAAADVVAGLDDGHVWSNDLLLAVAVDRFAPIPGVLAAARVADDARDSADALHDALLDCFGGETLGSEGGVEMHVLFDGEDLPLVVARSDDLFLAGSRPDLVRGALRRAAGAEEPSLADHPAAFTGEPVSGARVLYDAAALADVIAGALPIPPDEEAIVAAVDRVAAIFRTVGAGGSRIVLDDAGWSALATLVPDADGGDAELYDLLTCATCTSGEPMWAPEGAVSASGSSLRLTAWMDWLDGVVGDVSAAMGEPTTVRAALRDELGLDLDALLLSWLGDEIHTVRLDAFSPDLADLLYQPASATIVPVTSAAEAEAGLDALFEAVSALPSLPSDMDDFATLGTMLSVRDAEIAGVAVRRVQIGPTTDLAIGVVDDHLVIATPSTAFADVLAVVQGSVGDDRDSEGWSAVVDASPAGRIGWSYGNGGADLAGVAETLRLVAQPIAASISIGLSAALEEARSEEATTEADFGSFDDEQPLVDLNGITGSGGIGDALPVDARPLAPNTPVDAELGPDATLAEFGETVDVWGPMVVPSGTEASIVMTSEPLDTYLYLYDAETGTILAENDDAPWTDRSEIRFLSDGRALLVGATIWGSSGQGEYRIELIVDEETVDAEEDTDGAEGADDAASDDAVEEPLAEVPPFEDLLTLVEIGPEALAIVADRLGLSWTVTTSDDGTIRTEHRQAFDW